MEAKVIIKDGKANITVYADGAIHVASDSHPNWDSIIDAVENNSQVDWAELFSLRDAIAKRLDHLSERVAVSGDTLYFDGEPVDNSLADQTLKIYREDGDFQGLVLFMENIATNPNEHSRTQLYDWLRNHDFTITSDGMIVGYKGVSNNPEGGYQSSSSGQAYVNGELVVGQIPNAVGDIIEMPRNEVTHNPSESCSTGLHVGTFRYAKSWADGAMLEVHINPRDVVSVPTDAFGEKIRVCRYRVIDVIEEEHSEASIPAVEEPTPVPDNYVTPGKPRFTELRLRAKAQKKGFRKFAEKKDWILAGDDPEDRKSWKAPSASKRKGK